MLRAADLRQDYEFPNTCSVYIEAGPWGRLNIKILSYQYRDSHYKDKTVSRRMKFPIFGKTVYILRRGAPISYRDLRHMTGEGVLTQEVEARYLQWLTGAHQGITGILCRNLVHCRWRCGVHRAVSPAPGGIANAHLWKLFCHVLQWLTFDSYYVFICHFSRPCGWVTHTPEFRINLLL